MHSPVSISRLYGLTALKFCFLYFLPKENSQLVIDFPHRPNMSTPHIQELVDSDDSTVSGSSVPSEPGNFEMGWLVSCQTRWKMDWRWWKMLMLGIDMSWLFCCFDVLIEPRRWSLFLFAQKIGYEFWDKKTATSAGGNETTKAWHWHYHLHFGIYIYI